MKRAAHSFLAIVTASLLSTGVALGAGKIADVDDSNFKTEVGHQKGLVLVDFYATWCGPCKMMEPVLEALAGEHSDIKFVRVDTDKAQKTSHHAGVLVMPMFNLYRDGQLIGTATGEKSKQQLLEFIAKASGSKD